MAMVKYYKHNKFNGIKGWLQSMKTVGFSEGKLTLQIQMRGENIRHSGAPAFYHKVNITFKDMQQHQDFIH